MARIEVKSEMAGTILEVLVGAGDLVTTGQELLIVESMKMEVPVESPADGRVAELAIAASAVIAEGDLLLVIESSG
ncbi:MAG: acetyl-CoA carboxylase biotin carboxyl carrier protein subunit [Dehalococcoidia bacterium]|nr:acetyl-CoA carboxylase biotin carboxyl carrier protein subunit [Dehalococcoidia bacterium]MCB9485054.1 acetyl-CoA carboxylase biotin carboxyl carrier protein subunit [Thermoflexaceae bacterium]